MLVTRTANLLCPLALTDMSYSGVTLSPSPASASSNSDDDDTVLVAIVIALAVAMLFVCGFAAIMYTKEKAGEPMFRPLKDMDTDGLPKEGVAATEVGVEIGEKK